MRKMKCYFGLILLSALPWLTGCITLRADPRLVGPYLGEESESLVFLADTAVLHLKVVDGREERFFLGYAAAHSSTLGSLSIIAPDTSPFIGTSFQVSDDFSRVTVDWDNFRKPKDNWQVSYQRKPNAN